MSYNQNTTSSETLCHEQEDWFFPPPIYGDTNSTYFVVTPKMEPNLHPLAEDELPPNPYSELYSTTLVFSPSRKRCVRGQSSRGFS